MNENLMAIRSTAATTAAEGGNGFATETDLATDRRGALKAGLTATVALGSALAASESSAQKKAPAPKVIVRPPSPSTTPFVDVMPIIQELPCVRKSELATTTQAGFDTFRQFASTKVPNRTQFTSGGLPVEGRGDAHQFRELAEPEFFYVMRYGALNPNHPNAKIHAELPGQSNIWGANLGSDNFDVDSPMSPLPTIVSRYSDHRDALSNNAIVVRRFNNLPTGSPAGGFGKNSISVHLHNFHTGPDSDGGPCDPSLGALSETAQTQGRFFFPGQYYDHYYNMKRSGFIDPGTYTANGTTKTTPNNVVARLNPAMPNGDVRETLSTLWYHDHREGSTGVNVYKGLAGFHLIFNEYDTGDENTGFKLPSYPKYDIPILATDIWVDPGSRQMSIYSATSTTNGLLGDKYLVNGKIQPKFSVEKRRYRLRLLNKGPSRFQRLYLTNPANPAQSIPFWQITTDGNFLTKPLNVTNVKLAPAERVDVIVDFAKIAAQFGATQLWLENREVQVDPEKPAGSIDTPGKIVNVLMRFDIGALPAVPDASADPASISSFSPISLPGVPTPAITRTFDWNSTGASWTINGQLVDCTRVRFWMKRGRPERWVFNIGGGWGHPLHHHFVEGRITRRNGVNTASNSPEFSRKDVVPLYPGDSVEYVVTATDFVGVYPYHCHNVIHEDAGMMLLFGVDDTGDNLTTP